MKVGIRNHRLWIALWVGMMLAVVLPAPVLAAPAAEINYEIAQPDGSKFTVTNRGDEWSNWVETAEGYAIAPSSNGYWYYVEEYVNDEPILGNTYADDPPPQHLPTHISPAVEPLLAPPQENADQRAAKAPFGAFSGPVLFILTEFSNRSGSTSEASWGSFVSNGIVDYFNKTSHGKVNLAPANESSGASNNGVVGWVNVGYAHPDTRGGTGTANQQLTKDAILAANSYVNFAAYDTNKDGYVDADELAIVVVAAGYETAYCGNYHPSVWGHQWSIWSISPPVVDGVTVGAFHSGGGGYAQFGELHRCSTNDQHQATMGIMVHELGHLIFGLPDLYDTDGSSSGIGAFCLMSSGSWGAAATDNWGGQTPVLASAWVRYSLGWVNGPLGSGTASITAAGASNANSANTVYRATGTSSEYFLVENRQPAGYDRGLQRWFGNSFGGLAIWHIDDTRTSNSNDARRWVDLEEADGTLMGESAGTATDFWYAGNANTFNNTSNPNSKLYNGSASGVDINSISSSATVMTANFGASPQPPATPGTPNASDGTYTDKVRVIWSKVTGADTYEAYRCTTSSTGSCGTKIASSTGASYDDTGASPGTTYYYRVKACNSAGCSNFSGYDSGFVQETPAVPGIPSGITATDGTYSDKVRVTWNAVTGAESYEMYRCTTTSTGSCGAKIASPTGTSYDHTGASPGTTYYYRVKACNSAGCSNLSGYDSGFAQETLTVPNVPGRVTATDGTYTTKVSINWDVVAGTETYEVYRCTTTSTGSCGTKVASPSGASYDDTGATPGTTYYYRVKACNSAGCSNFSTYDTGYRANEASLPPAKFGVFRSGLWFLDKNGDGAWSGCGIDGCIGPFGAAGDQPVVGDWNGDGVDEIGYKRGSDWFLDYNGNGVMDSCATDVCIYGWGVSTDAPVIGDWNGDGVDEIGYKRGSDWFLDYNGNGVLDSCTTDVCIYGWGTPADKPVIGDWNGDGVDEIGVKRGGSWFLDHNGNGSWDGCTVDSCVSSWGAPADKPVIGDWNGDGADEIGVKRGGSWFLDNTGNTGWDGCAADSCLGPFGNATDVPFAGQW